MKKAVDENIPGQIDLLNYLETLNQKDTEVEVEGVINLKSKPISHYKVTASYGDIVLIVSMLRDYVKALDEVRKEDIQWQAYYREKFLQIANKFQSQIEYDYDKAVEKCRKKAEKQTKGNDIGEDALLLALKKQSRGKENDKDNSSGSDSGTGDNSVNAEGDIAAEN